MRKIKFSLDRLKLAYDDYTDGEGKKLIEERDGYFHEWGKEITKVDNISLELSIGIVEEISSGKVFQVLPNKVIFIN